jgi:acyl-CoA thioesterase FadM
MSTPPAVDRFTTFVTLQHTDAVGVLFAASPMSWAQLGFENLLRAAGRPLETVLWSDVHYPIAKLQIEHCRRLVVGVEIDVETYVERVGNRSIEFRTDIRVSETGELACFVSRVGVAVAQDHSPATVEPWLRALARS